MNMSELPYGTICLSSVDNQNPDVSYEQMKNAILDSLQDYLDDFELVVKDVGSNYIVVQTDKEDEKIEFGDDLDLESGLLLAIITSHFNMTTPKISLAFSVNEDDKSELDEDSQYLTIDGFVLSDFDKTVMSIMDDESESDYVCTFSGRDLYNTLVGEGIISFDFSDSPNRDTLSNESNLAAIRTDYGMIGMSDLGVGSTNLDSGESTEGGLSPAFESKDSKRKVQIKNPTKGSIAREQKLKRIRKKRLRLARMKDPVAARKRSRAAKLRWKKNRVKMVRGMRKFNRSVRGRRINRQRSKKLSIIRSNDMYKKSR